MREGLLPPYATVLAALITGEAEAKRIANQITETFEPEEVAASAFEQPQADPDLPCDWLCEIYFAEPPDEDLIRDFVEDLAGAALARALTFQPIAAKDWVSASLDGLKPVPAGRFVVHGRHDRSSLKPGQIGVEIEAALAFGTGHHGTTRGCLLHLDLVLKRRRPVAIVDIGTGTGILAIAAAKALKIPVQAGEIDADSVRVARENAKLNACASWVQPVVARGLSHAALRGVRRYDLVFANILARPLKGLSRNVALATHGRGELILSGLLLKDVAGVLAAYRLHGFYLVRRINLEGWSSLLLRRGGAGGARAHRHHT
jgi:ribosomal protein L11 methyltransferase